MNPTHEICLQSNSTLVRIIGIAAHLESFGVNNVDFCNKKIRFLKKKFNVVLDISKNYLTIPIIKFHTMVATL